MITAGTGAARFLFSDGSKMSWPASVLLLGSRLYAGVTIASAGLDKLPAPPWMVDQVTQIGFPAPGFFATAACLTEFTCGLLLALGLLTRPAALMLSFTMGVASFGFHKLTPIFDMHIAQGFFWLFVVFAAVGGGRLAVDRLLWRFGGSGEQVRLGRMTAIAGPLLMAVMIAGVVLERRNPPTAENGADVAITSINLVGSFNQWNLAAQPMTADGPVWRTRVHFNEPGRIEFKFAANQSWNLSLGAESQPSTTLPLQGVGEPRSGNIAADITAPGDYEFTVDGASFNYAVRPVEPSAQLFDPTNLLGSWQIDLRPTPASEPHLVTLQIDAVEDGVCTGNFYNGSPIQSGRIATNHGVLTFAFVTEDGSGPYHTSGRLTEAGLEGTTHSIGRSFLMAWTGERIP